MKISESNLRQRPETFLGEVRELKKGYLHETFTIAEDECYEPLPRRQMDEEYEDLALLGKEGAFLAHRATAPKSKIDCPEKNWI
jgi:hypothetical protein